MKIAINCVFFQPKGGGIKEYIDNLVNNLAKLDSENEYVLYVLKDQLDYAKKNLPSKFKIKTLPFVSGSKFNRIKRSLFEKKFWLNEEKIEKFDLFHSPFFHAPKLKNTKLLLTVHDLRLYRFPETYEFFRYQYLKRRVKESIKKADHIISISNFTKQEIIELCGIDPEKITVIHEAINPSKFNASNITEPDDVPEVIKQYPYILSVGHMEPRKNYDRLIHAYLKLKENPALKDLQLVIVGKKDHSFKSTLNKIKDTPGIHYLDFVDGNTLLWLYQQAQLFVFPSYYEGFGFPPLEAAILGTISAVSNVSSIPEICGDTELYFDPYDVDGMVKTMTKALTDKTTMEKETHRLKDAVDRFSWEKNARETINVYHSFK